MSQIPYDTSDREAVDAAQQSVNDLVLPILAGARTKGQAFLIATGVASTALALAAGAFAALHGLDEEAVDHLDLGTTIIAMMKKAGQQ